MSKNLAVQESEKLSRLLDNGYLKEVETSYRVIERKGKKYTRITKAFKIEVKGVVLPDNEEKDNV